ncbi:MAG: phytoene desaturase [Saprospiraceae bacterium]|nr:phytoene desaturase [Saprospiraceae bacterium]
MKKKVIVIGAGFSGLSAATHLAAKGFDVTILEKNTVAGGRARLFEASTTEGVFRYDMGPSWYWMPDIFDQYFADFGKNRADYYDLIRLDPSYTVTFEDGDIMHLPAKMSELEALFEKYERGSAAKLRQFLAEAKYKYEVGVGEFVNKPAHSLWEFADWRVISSVFRLQMLTSLSSAVRKLFKNEKLIQLLEFPVLFLGATPQKTPALYSMMNYADMSLGTWYPKGGMFEIVKAMVTLAEEKGVKIQLGQEVRRLETEDGSITKILTQDSEYQADIVVGSADYHHLEQEVLAAENRQYTEGYWESRTMAPSSFLYYLGINKRLKNLEHHNLYFDADFGLHAQEIYETPKLPTKPLFYVSAPSKTDPSVAPENCENLFVLIPTAPDKIDDSEATRDHYYNLVMERLEHWTGQDIRSHVVFKRTYAHSDFKNDYHAFKGNAYGLANTLRQTAFLKPKMKSKKVKNLWYTGQLTTPGPGVPPSLISGKVVAEDIFKLKI